MSIPSRIASWMPATRAAGGAAWDGLAPRSRMTGVAPFEIHSLEFGTGEEQVVLLHGLSGSALWWRRNVPALAKRYRVVLPELVGFGRSPAPRRLPPVAETADLLDGWMGELGLQRVHLVGHSMGGQIAIHLAARHPSRLDRLVLVDAAGIPRPLTPRNALRFAMEVGPLWRWGDPRFLPTVVRDALIAGPRTVVGAIAHILRDDVRPLLARITAPTLIVWGERDNLVPLLHGAELRQRIPHAQLAVLRGAGHNPMVDRAADFNRVLLRFLGGESVGR
jgi:pimeloyl-ACP methyl ester carboxylesterase